MHRSMALRVVIVSLLVIWSALPAWAAERTVIHFWYAVGGQLAEAIDTLVKQFNASQDQFEVRAIRRGNYPETISAAIAAFRAGTPPHIIQVYEVGTQTMMYSGAIYPVYRLMQDQGFSIDWDDFIGPVRSYYELDGQLYSMPFNASTPILYYNKDALRRGGLDPEQPPATWNELVDWSRGLIGAGIVRWGFTASWPSWTLLENMFAWHDQPFASQENGYKGLDVELLVNSDFGRTHMRNLASWHQEGIFRYGGRGADPDVMFTSGQVAFLLQSSGLIGSFSRALTFNWGTGELPHYGPPYRKQNSILGGASLWVMRGHSSQQYRGVAEFLAYIAQPEQQAWWHATTGYLPVSHSAIRLLEERGHFEQNPNQRTALAQLTHSTPTANSRGLRLGYFVQIRDIIEGEMENIFGGRKSPEQGLQDMVRESNRILQEFEDLNG